MSSTQQNSISHDTNNSHFYSDPRSIFTVVLWVVALSTHAILIPRLVRELYGEFAKRNS